MSSSTQPRKTTRHDFAAAAAAADIAPDDRQLTVTAATTTTPAVAVSALGKYQMTLEQIQQIDLKAASGGGSGGAALSNASRSLADLCGYRPSTLRRKNRRNYAGWDDAFVGDGFGVVGTDGDAGICDKRAAAAAAAAGPAVGAKTKLKRSQTHGNALDFRNRIAPGAPVPGPLVIAPLLGPAPPGQRSILAGGSNSRSSRSGSNSSSTFSSGSDSFTRNSSNRRSSSRHTKNICDQNDDADANGTDHHYDDIRSAPTNNKHYADRDDDRRQQRYAINTNASANGAIKLSTATASSSLSPPHHHHTLPAPPKSVRDPSRRMRHRDHNAIAPGALLPLTPSAPAPSAAMGKFNTISPARSTFNIAAQLNHHLRTSTKPTAEFRHSFVPLRKSSAGGGGGRQQLLVPTTQIGGGTSSGSSSNRSSGGSNESGADGVAFVIPRPRLIVPVHSYARKRRTGNLRSGGTTAVGDADDATWSWRRSSSRSEQHIGDERDHDDDADEGQEERPPNGILFVCFFACVCGNVMDRDRSIRRYIIWSFHQIYTVVYRPQYPRISFCISIARIAFVLCVENPRNITSHAQAASLNVLYKAPQMGGVSRFAATNDRGVAETGGVSGGGVTLPCLESIYLNRAWRGWHGFTSRLLSWR